ncbi:MAG TPA: NUDIX domain-containing protein [Acidimicrobiales bacterium]
MVAAAHRALLRVWRRVPRGLRQRIVRAFTPSFTVGAACVIERGDGSILLVRLSYRDKWGLPGGLLERHEEVATCARREVLEEVGLEVDLVGEPAVVVDSRPQRVDVVFRARPAQGADAAAVRPRSVEVLETAWFPAGDLPPLQHEAVSALIALASSALGPAEVAPGASRSGGDGSGTGDAGEAGGAAGAAGTRQAAGGTTTLRLAAGQAAGQRRSLAS